MPPRKGTPIVLGTIRTGADLWFPRQTVDLEQISVLILDWSKSGREHRQVMNLTVGCHYFLPDPRLSSQPQSVTTIGQYLIICRHIRTDIFVHEQLA